MQTNELLTEGLADLHAEALLKQWDPGSGPNSGRLARCAMAALANVAALQRIPVQAKARCAVDISYQLISCLVSSEPLYIPTGRVSVPVAARKRAVIQEFTGRNYAQLARKHGITEMRVRQILLEERRRTTKAADQLKPSPKSNNFRK